MVADNLERKVHNLEGRFIFSGQDLNEIFHDRDSEEFYHFLDEFSQKIRDIDGLKAEPIENFYVSPLRSPNLFLAEIEIASSTYRKRLDIKSFISIDVRRRLNGRFEWTGKDGKKIKVFIKKNKTFVDRKMGKLMYEVFKKTLHRIQQHVYLQSQYLMIKILFGLIVQVILILVQILD